MAYQLNIWLMITRNGNVKQINKPISQKNYGQCSVRALNVKIKYIHWVSKFRPENRNCRAIPNDFALYPRVTSFSSIWFARAFTFIIKYTFMHGNATRNSHGTVCVHSVYMRCVVVIRRRPTNSAIYALMRECTRWQRFGRIALNRKTTNATMIIARPTRFAKCAVVVTVG